MKLYSSYKEKKLIGRYITKKDIDVLKPKHESIFKIDVLGNSVEKREIDSYSIGSGEKKILIWSQMHGNESTTTKALFDFFNYLHQESDEIKELLSNCTFCFVPMLNPDGAIRYTRLNANEVDLNRDAQDLSQPESKLLRQLYNDFKPDYCFNLHGQRTIFSAGYSANSAVLSFLSPAQDAQRAVTPSRKIGMKLIAEIANSLKEELPDHIARYDDGFNLNCVGDTFQSLQTPTILFEAGHYPNDYDREETRAYIFKALIFAFNYIAGNTIEGGNYAGYFKLPENQKMFSDIIIRNVKNELGDFVDVAIQYQEELSDGKVVFIPKVDKVGDLEEFFGHKEIDGEFKSIIINGQQKINDSLGIIKEIRLDGEDFVKKIKII